MYKSTVQGRTAYTALLISLTAATALYGQTFKVLDSFDGLDGAYPYYSGLVQARDGNLYGTTSQGGRAGWGTVFRITPSGVLTTLHSFCSQAECADGVNPVGGLIQATDGNLYGTTAGDGVGSYPGTVFKITPAGTLTTLYSFCSQAGCTDGNNPAGTLVQATDGNLYGTAGDGGANNGGTVFRITLSGTLSTLYSFCSQANCTDGLTPVGSLMQATDGNFYGTTAAGGIRDGSLTGFGTVFMITSSGALTTLHRFDYTTDGAEPIAGLVQAADGNLYGTTEVAGPNGGQGTIFKTTPGGAFTTLYSFCSLSGCADGGGPEAALIQATDGALYGATTYGGPDGYGTVFKFQPDGVLATLHSFDLTDGGSPSAPLVQGTNGEFCGTTPGGGADGFGTIFSLSVGLKPFVELQPPFGKAGSVIKILGTGLTGATSVSFNGTAAMFKVISGSEISAIVPYRATSGAVSVVTPGGTLLSNESFRVTQGGGAVQGISAGPVIHLRPVVPSALEHRQKSSIP